MSGCNFHMALSSVWLQPLTEVWCATGVTVAALVTSVIRAQAQPYFRLDCNAGGSLHALSTAAQPSPNDTSSQGEGLQNLIALEHVAPLSNGTAASLHSIQAVSIGQGKDKNALQAGSQPADRFANGSSTCSNGAAASPEAAQLRSHGSEGDSAFLMELPYPVPTSAATHKMQAGLFHA